MGTKGVKSLPRGPERAAAGKAGLVQGACEQRVWSLLTVADFAESNGPEEPAEPQPQPGNTGEPGGHLWPLGSVPFSLVHHILLLPCFHPIFLLPLFYLFLLFF